MVWLSRKYEFVVNFVKSVNIWEFERIPTIFDDFHKKSIVWEKQWKQEEGKQTGSPHCAPESSTNVPCNMRQHGAPAFSDSGARFDFCSTSPFSVIPRRFSTIFGKSDVFQWGEWSDNCAKTPSYLFLFQDDYHCLHLLPTALVTRLLRKYEFIVNFNNFSHTK